MTSSCGIRDGAIAKDIPRARTSSSLGVSGLELQLIRLLVNLLGCELGKPTDLSLLCVPIHTSSGLCTVLVQGGPSFRDRLLGEIRLVYPWFCNLTNQVTVFCVLKSLWCYYPIVINSHLSPHPLILYAVDKDLRVEMSCI